MSFSIESEITDPSALWPFTCFPPFVFYRLDCYRCFHFSRYPFFQISRYHFRRDLISVFRDCGRFYFEFIRHWLCSWSIFILWGSIYKKKRPKFLVKISQKSLVVWASSGWTRVGFGQKKKFSQIWKLSKSFMLHSVSDSRAACTVGWRGAKRVKI